MTRDALKATVLDSLRMNRSVIILMLAYIVFALVLGRLAEFHVGLRVYDEKSSILMFFSFWIILIPVLVRGLYQNRPVSPLSFTWYFLVKNLRTLERVAVALPCVLLFPLFASAFTSVKSAIGHIHPFRFDPLFEQLDSAIHGGHAWELVHPLVGYPIVTFSINFSYNIWVFVVWFTFSLALVMMGNRRLREQYLLTFFGCWILIGSVAAIALSSAGPAFYGLIHPDDPYASLMSYLRSVDEVYPVWAVWTQDMLWEKYLANSTGLGSGISAMPSVHVALATVNALLLSRLSRIAGVLGWVYLAMIMIGSVHLGWHYAIDGYVSIIAVLLMWRAAGWWAARSAAPAPAPVGVVST